MAFENLLDVFSPPDYYKGLLGEQAVQDLQKRANTTALINAALGYFAQPKTQGYGSALPYIAKSLAGGFTAGQNVIDTGLKEWEIKQKIEALQKQKEEKAAFDALIPQLYKTTPAQYQTIPQGYAPQQTAIDVGQIAPNYGLTKLPDMTYQVAPATQTIDPATLQRMFALDPSRGASVAAGLKAVKELTTPDKVELLKAGVGESFYNPITKTWITSPVEKEGKQSPLLQLQTELDSFAPNDPRRKIWEKKIELETTRSPGIQVSYAAPIAGLDAQGNPIFFQPSKTGGAPSIVSGVSPLREEKPATEAQAKAGAFASQMRTATNELARLEREGYDPSKIETQFETRFAETALTGLTDPLAQQANQAQQQWSEAYLRFKTGAAATEGEVKRNMETFFPQIGEKPATIAQKARMRKQAEKDVENAAKQPSTLKQNAPADRSRADILKQYGL